MCGMGVWRNTGGYQLVEASSPNRSVISLVKTPQSFQNSGEHPLTTPRQVGVRPAFTCPAIIIRRPIGAMVRTLTYCARGRGFNSRTVQTLHEHVCLYWVWVFSTYSMYVFTKKKYTSSVIYPLSTNRNTSLISAYFGLDKRECLEYLFIRSFFHYNQADCITLDLSSRSFQHCTMKGATTDPLAM
jgi:hypothetical protein